MSYTADTLLHATFDDTLFINEIDGDPAVQGGTPTLVEGQFNDGWQMAASATAGFFTTAPTNAFTIGFWLKPKNPGVITNGSTTESLTQALISKCGFTTIGITTSTVSLTLVIYERTLENNENVMVVQLGGIDQFAVPTTSTTTSTSYDADVWHYFWIVFDGSIPSLRIYRNLSLDSATTVGTVPTTLTVNGNFVGVNLDAPGFSYNRARNLGVIDDLVFFNTAKTTATTIARAANLGAKFVGDEAFTSVNEIDIPLVFDDDSTIQINSVFATRGNVYISRSDGKLMRGIKTVWRSRRDFSNTDELKHVSVISRGSSSPELSSGAIVLQNEVIRV